MDPALWELLRAEAGADGDRVLEAIIRFARPGIEIPGVRIVSRFGPIATCRIRARDVIAIRARRDVVSVKAPRLLSPGFEPALPPLDPVGPALPSTCATDLRRGPALTLTGAGVVVASVDWGVDMDSAAFRWPGDSSAADGDHEAGATRFLSFWDQRDQALGPRPEPYCYGAVHDQEEIDRALRSPRPYEYLGYHPAIADPKGTGSHGTHVLDIAAGNGQAGGPAGIAPGAHLIFVHLADRNTGGLANFGDSVRLLEAVDFISRTAGARPCVINISAGRVCGPKDSTTLVERALDELLATTPGRFVANSAGNYFRWRTHSCGAIAPGEVHVLTFTVDPADITVNELEIWYDGGDEFTVRIDPPGYTGGRAVRLGERSDLLIEGRVIGRVYHRKHDPNNGDNHIVAFLDPIGRAGNWTVTLEARQVSSGRFHAWIERDDSCPGCQARFTRDDSNPVTTIGTITTSHLPLVVGAYDGHDPVRPAAPFTSGGPSRDGRDKPDFAAPGVGVLAARSAPVGASRNPGLVVRKSGTSMATPHVTGAVALCYEAAGNRLSAQEIRSLVLDSCDPVTDSELQSRLGRGYLNIARLVADVQQTLATPTTVPDAKEPTMDTDAIVLLAAAPATAYREYLYRPRGQLARWIDDRYDVVARPGQPIGQPLQEGDVLLEVTLGRLSPGRYSTLAAGDLQLMAMRRRLAPGQLLLRPRRQMEMSQPLPVEPGAHGVPGGKDESDERRYGGAGFGEAAPLRDWFGEDDGPSGPGLWNDATEQKDFRARVLAEHIARYRKARGSPQRDLREDELSDIPGTCSTEHGKTTCVRTATTTAVAACRLLKAANAALAAAKKAGDADALRTVDLSATSGYRSQDYQKQLWLSYFTKYYNDSAPARATIPDGPHSDAAVDYMLQPKGYDIPGKVAAPGYSNHQGGIAVDFWQDRTKGNEIPNDSHDEYRRRWRKSWFHGWLRTHAAAAYGFQPIPTEEWHWEYRPAVKPDLTDYRAGKVWTFASPTHPQPVAVFCPKAALGQRNVDVLVFAHGLLDRCARPKRLPAGIVTDAPFELGRIVDRSGRPVVLVVPLLDWDHPCGEVVFGRGHERWHPLGKPAVLNAVVSEVLAEVGRVQGAAAPSLRELIVAGHSRAYDVLEPLAASRADAAMRQGALARLSQVWALDTTYNGDVSAWTGWLKLNPSLQLHLYYRPVRTKEADTKTVGDQFYAQRGGRLFVTQVKEEHCDVPATRLGELMPEPTAPAKPGEEEPGEEAYDDERLVPQTDPQQDVSTILQSLHAPAPAPHQDPVLSHGVLAASDQPGSTIESTTDEETPKVALADASATPTTRARGHAPGAAAPAAPPAEVAGWPLGVDLYEENEYKKAPISAAGFANLKSHGKVFAILRSSQGTKPDGQFPAYYQRAADAGLIRGTFHFFANKYVPAGRWGGTVAQQADMVIGLVRRLGPGDLAPALDLEDEGHKPLGRYPLDEGIRPGQTGYHYRTKPAGRDELVADAQDFLDRLETALGRTPIVYTSILWMDDLHNRTDLSSYPLWTVNHQRTARLADINVGGWGKNWDLLQYAEDGKTYFSMAHYSEAGIEIPGCDFDAYHGSLAGLRGLADLGRPAAAMTSAASYIAHAEADGSLHLRTGPSWTDHNLSAAELFGTIGDPEMLISGNDAFLYYVRHGRLREARSRSGAPWHDTDIDDGTAAFSNPRAVTDGTARHIAYWGQDDDWHLLSWHGAWTKPGGVLKLAGVETAAGGSSSGQPVPYIKGGTVHLVGRAGRDGHLHEVWQESGTWRHDDLTLLGRDLAPNMPTATYAPAVGSANGAPLIVFRGVRGDLWAISRSDNAPTNLTRTTRATGALGHPACFTRKGTEPHIIYRGADRLIHDIWLESGQWHIRQVCADTAAADPAVTTDGTTAFVAIRTTDNNMHVARFDGSNWTCTATPPMSDGRDDTMDRGILA